MGKNKKRTDGRYQKCFRFNGKTYCVYGKTPTEAETKKAEKIDLLINGEINHDDPTLNDYYKRFTEIRRNTVKGATIRGQLYQFDICSRIAINPNGKTLGETRIREIRSQDIKTVQMALLKTNLSERSINDYLSHLSHVFNSAIKEDIIEKNPCICLEKILSHKKPASETKHRALTKEETTRFFEAAAESYYLNHFKMLIQTGLRIGELCALTYSDTDYQNDCIHINKTITRNESGSYTVGQTTKTKNGIRDIPLTEATIRILSDQKQMNFECFGKTAKINDLLFKSSIGEILREYTINREISRICKKAHIEHFTCHAFRATYATRFIEQRPQDYKVLSEILGHANTKITLDLYTHVMQDTKNNAVKSIVISM